LNVDKVDAKPLNCEVDIKKYRSFHDTEFRLKREMKFQSISGEEGDASLISRHWACPSGSTAFALLLH
jgi:hypothetical protein